MFKISSTVILPQKPSKHWPMDSQTKRVFTLCSRSVNLVCELTNLCYCYAQFVHKKSNFSWIPGRLNINNCTSEPSKDMKQTPNCLLLVKPQPSPLTLSLDATMVLQSQSPQTRPDPAQDASRTQIRAKTTWCSFPWALNLTALSFRRFSLCSPSL